MSAAIFHDPYRDLKFLVLEGFWFAHLLEHGPNLLVSRPAALAMLVLPR
jgi:hypothetical protein